MLDASWGCAAAEHALQRKDDEGHFLVAPELPLADGVSCAHLATCTLRSRASGTCCMHRVSAKAKRMACSPKAALLSKHQVRMADLEILP